MDEIVPKFSNIICGALPPGEKMALFSDEVMLAPAEFIIEPPFSMEIPIPLALIVPLFVISQAIVGAVNASPERLIMDAAAFILAVLPAVAHPSLPKISGPLEPVIEPLVVHVAHTITGFNRPIIIKDIQNK